MSCSIQIETREDIPKKWYKKSFYGRRKSHAEHRRLLIDSIPEA